MRRSLFIFTAVFMTLSLACKDGSMKEDNKTPNLTDARIKLYRNKIEQDPSNYRNYDSLAQNYIQKARETGVANYYEDAKEAVENSLRIKPTNYVATVLLAKTEIANHRFSKALQYAKKSVGLEPESSAAYGILGDAYLELGEADRAEEAYKKMHIINPNMDSYSRIANLKFEQGKSGEAVNYMKMAYESGLKNSATPEENLAWAQFMIGSYYLDTGNLDKAEKYFKKSLEIFDNYYLTIEHLAELNYLKMRSLLKVKQKTPYQS